MYFGNNLLQLPINNDICQKVVVSVNTPKFILIVHRPLIGKAPSPGTDALDVLHFFSWQV